MNCAVHSGDEKRQQPPITEDYKCFIFPGTDGKVLRPVKPKRNGDLMND